MTEMEEFLCFMRGRLRPVRVTRIVTADGPDDPRAREGALIYEIELTNGQRDDLDEMIEKKLNEDVA